MSFNISGGNTPAPAAGGGFSFGAPASAGGGFSFGSPPAAAGGGATAPAGGGFSFGSTPAGAGVGSSATSGFGKLGNGNGTKPVDRWIVWHHSRHVWFQQ